MFGAVERKLLAFLMPAIFFTVSFVAESGRAIMIGTMVTGVVSITGFGTATPTVILSVPWAFERGTNASVASAAVRTMKMRFMLVISFMVCVVA